MRLKSCVYTKDVPLFLILKIKLCTMHIIRVSFFPLLFFGVGDELFFGVWVVNKHGWSPRRHICYCEYIYLVDV